MAIRKKETVIIKLRKLYDRLAPADSAAEKLMQSMSANEENYFSLLMATKDDFRSSAQNRLLWAFYTDMSQTAVNEYAGWSKEEWHYEMKKRFLVPIFERDDEGYALILTHLRKAYRDGDKAESEGIFKWLVKEKTSTTDATIQQFTEYLNEINRFCGENGIMLRTDKALFDMAMNG